MYTDKDRMIIKNEQGDELGDHSTFYQCKYGLATAAKETRRLLKKTICGDQGGILHISIGGDSYTISVQHVFASAPTAYTQ